jgi:hypothetical protein
LSNLGHELARSMIAEILERHGIEPAPERNRKTTCKEFLTRHWQLIVAADFFGRMETINRSAIVVMPAQPFLDWLQRVDPGGKGVEPGGSEARVDHLPDLDTFDD